MKKHRPNVVSLKTRVFLTICSLFLLIFVLIELAIGYTYMPGKRGGIMLSGIPTLMLAAAAFSLLLAATMTIVDHYDKRPNEIAYKKFRSICYKFSLYTFIFAPLIELTEYLLHLNGLHPFPTFRGFADQFSLHSPELKQHIHLVSPILNNSNFILLVSVPAMMLGALLHKFFQKHTKSLSMLLCGVGMFGLSLLGTASAVKDLFDGEVVAGRRHSKFVVSAESEPAKFNAILLTHFAMGGFMLLGSTTVVVGLVTNKLKPR